jgi:hypothetical protein
MLAAAAAAAAAGHIYIILYTYTSHRAVPAIFIYIRPTAFDFSLLLSGNYYIFFPE